jgi:hypothetical protein
MRIKKIYWNRKRTKTDTPVETTLISAFVYLMQCKKKREEEKKKQDFKQHKKYIYFV